MKVAAQGVSLAVHELGGPAGAPLLLWVHANGLASRAYGPLLRLLASHAQVFAMDLRGHGESDPVPLPLEAQLQMEVLESDLSLVLQAIGERGPSVHLGAHSLGALPALRCMARGNGLVASATLFEGAVYPPPGHAARAEAEALTAERVARTPRRRAIWSAVSDFADALARAPAFAAMPPEDRLEAAEALLRPDAQGYRLRCDPLVETFLFTQVALAAEFDLLAEVRNPVQIVAGDAAHAGATWVTRMQPDIASAVPGARFECVAGSGHLVPLEAPEACARLLHEWMMRNHGKPHRLG